MKKRPNKLWAFWANHYGPSDLRPVRVTWDAESEAWWARDCNRYVISEGCCGDDTGRYEVFSSESKADVELFILGFNAARRIMATFTAGLPGQK